MKFSAEKKRVGRNEVIETNETKQKKPYIPPRVTVLTSDQAEVWLRERTLRAQAAIEHPLTASPLTASPLGPSRTDGQRPILGGAKPRPTKKGA